MMPLRRFRAPSSTTYVPTALSFMMTRTKIRPTDDDDDDDDDVVASAPARQIRSDHSTSLLYETEKRGEE